MVYCAPEALVQGGRLNTRLVDALHAMTSRGARLVLSIDEAHLLTDWGTSFRPAFMALGQLREASPGVP